MNHVDLVIPADFEADFTSEWDGYTHQTIFPSVYRRYRAPISEQECQDQIDSLTELITSVNDQYDEVREEAFRAGLTPATDPPTKAKLKSMKSARTRYEAVRRAYIHWLCLKRGEPSSVVLREGTQMSTNAKINALSSALKVLISVYLDDLLEGDNEEGLIERLATIKKQLDAVFATP